MASCSTSRARCAPSSEPGSRRSTSRTCTRTTPRRCGTGRCASRIISPRLSDWPGRSASESGAFTCEPRAIHSRRAAMPSTNSSAAARSPRGPLPPPPAPVTSRRAGESRRSAFRPRSPLSKPVHIGCSGWNYRDWRGVIYPEGLPARRWLERYAELFDTVEINATFYRLPSENAVKTWVEQTPRGFVFAVKASRYLTHVKRLKAVDQGAKRFFDPLGALVKARKLGPILWQLPESFQR